MRQQQASACATWGMPGLGPSGTQEDSHAASTPPTPRWKPGRHFHNPPHMCLGGRAGSPSSGGAGHSFLLPRLLQTHLEGGNGENPPGSGVQSGQTSAQETQAGGSTELQGQSAGPSDLSSPLPKRPFLRGHKAPKLRETVFPRWSGRPGGTKRAPSPDQGLCPTPGPPLNLVPTAPSNAGPGSS